MSKRVKEYHKEFDALYGDHEPNLSLSKVELAASEAAYSWQSDKEGLTLEMFPEAFKRGFLKGYEQAEQNIVSLIESRIAEILGDAQPAPVLRAELRELIERIKEESK